MPVAVGRKLTVMVQLAPAPTLVPHALVCRKLLALIPFIEKPVIVIAVLPILVNVIVCGALIVPTF